MRFFDPDTDKPKKDGGENLPQSASVFAGTVLERLPDGLVVIGEDRSVISMNALARTYLGLGKAEPGNVESLLESSPVDMTEIEAVLQSGAAADVITQAADGRAILSSIRFLRDANKSDIGVTIILRDLQMIDRQRKLAAGARLPDRFKFTRDKDAAIDFSAQRRLSDAIDTIVKKGERALSVGARILLSGESGSGKTELAKHLHRRVGNPEEPFIHVNCGSIPEQLFESEMFGHAKGAFTGASPTGRRGLIEEADGGTLFLDEIGEMPIALQAKLLKFLDDGYVQQIGARKGKRVTCRVISASNRDLWSLVQEGTFRADLYYRLAAAPLTLAPLREQPKLVDHLIDRALGRINDSRDAALSLDETCRARLRSYAFPGNIRELHNVVFQLSLIDADVATVGDLPAHVVQGQPVLSVVSSQSDTDETGDLKAQVRAFERTIIDDAIRLYGSKRKAAAALGIDIGTIVRKSKSEAGS